jgi:hypothetical protein
VVLVIVLILLITALVVLCTILFRQYQHIQRLDYISARKTSWFATIHTPGTLTAQNADLIEDWMTFDYINHLFKIPADYFKTTLSITNARYPRLTIAHFASETHIQASDALISVQNAVRAYFVVLK